jgi:hypothetical protein
MSKKELRYRAAYHMLLKAGAHVLFDGRNDVAANAVISAALLELVSDFRNGKPFCQDIWTQWRVWMEHRPPNTPEFAHPVYISSTDAGETFSTDAYREP